jgi:hypothetical protein
MGDKKEEPIDLNKLSQRELLILCVRDVQELKEKDKEREKLAMQVNTLETKIKVWGAIAGFVSGGLIIIFEHWIK